ncbi:MAG: hypothetical protein A2Z99_04460 [Treponema sp. GWB1_62_6]|nr:MAG: hypothetical protein A2001_03770 [Treponema sp. GWC1_61_84]OHE70246.1 MAG: hypothetical protein A2Z99_04460 [Treponema sp. GWB1_62_6]HCM26396.1 hypothetical protein [Treponema sp.]
MAPSSRKDNLEHEALNYIKLGTLVQRERPPETAAAIEEILSKNIPVEEKIKEIELVDGVPAPPVTSPPASRPYLSRPRDGGTDEEIIPRKPKQSVLAAARRRAKMIADIEATGVMDYLFKERRNVKKGAAGNLLLRPRLLSVEFREESARTLIERLQRETLPALDASLDLILAEGWRFLTKADYNLVALLRRLSASTARLIPSKLSPRWPQAAKGMYSLGIAFLPFRMEPGRAAAALSAVGTALAKLNYDGESLELARKHVIHLLQDGGPPACLQDLLLASAMVKARRFLSIGSLTKSDAGMLSSVEEFDCSNEVQDAIDVRIAELLEHLSELDETDKEAQQVRAFVKTDEAGDIDFLPLISFYEKGKTGGGSWDKDSDKLPVLVYNLVERFTAAAKPMADAESRRAGQGDSLGTALSYELSRLSVLEEKLRRLAPDCPIFPWARFMGIKSKALRATTVEAEAAALASEAADHFAACGRILSAALLGADPDGGTESGADARFMERLAERERMAGTTSAAYLAAFKLQDPAVVAIIKNERKVKDKIANLRAEFERLADAETFRAAITGTA